MVCIWVAVVFVEKVVKKKNERRRRWWRRRPRRKGKKKRVLLKHHNNSFLGWRGRHFLVALPHSLPLSLSLHLLLLRTDEKGGYIQCTQHTRYDEADATDDDGLMNRLAKGPSRVYCMCVCVYTKASDNYTSDERIFEAESALSFLYSLLPPLQSLFFFTSSSSSSPLSLTHCVG